MFNNLIKLIIKDIGFVFIKMFTIISTTITIDFNLNILTVVTTIIIL
jgi:hypothetical protein